MQETINWWRQRHRTGIIKSKILSSRISAKYDIDSSDPKLTSLSTTGIIATSDLSRPLFTDVVVCRTELPSTGGDGNKVIYILGTVFCSWERSVLLVSQGRMKKEK